jgi:hypothetical protein
MEPIGRPKPVREHGAEDPVPGGIAISQLAISRLSPGISSNYGVLSKSQDVSAEKECFPSAMKRSIATSGEIRPLAGDSINTCDAQGRYGGNAITPMTAVGA